MTLHTYTPQPMSLPSMNFLHLTVSEIQPGQTISHRPPDRLPAHPDTMGENNTPTALKGCGVKNRCHYDNQRNTHIHTDIYVLCNMDKIVYILQNLSDEN